MLLQHILPSMQSFIKIAGTIQLLDLI